MAHQLGIVFVEERIAVVGEVDDEGILLAVVLYDLVDDVVGIEKAIGVGRDDGILHRILSVGEAVVGEACEGLGVALAVGHVRAHEMHHLEESEGRCCAQAVGEVLVVEEQGQDGFVVEVGAVGDTFASEAIEEGGVAGEDIRLRAEEV